MLLHCVAMTAGLKMVVSFLVPALLLVVVYSSSTNSGVGAQVHDHVVGGDRGWDPSSDISSWSSGKIFLVGQQLWFTYSAAHGNIVEVKSKEEYEACDLRNPIRMYTDGIDSVSLEEEGMRYFASSREDSCKKGLKLHVEVQPASAAGQPEKSKKSGSVVLAAAPTTPTPSSSYSLTATYPPISLLLGFWLMNAIFMAQFM